ncbi:slipin family protein [Candidatus Hecatella orcuttiae]|jgi:regulator of protease activity HflC (stomatin/prohibitin superfamily)|uniref:slipin family protein n=1 Tax=Candidatus Hecatella orcuttiae TaxID=1935119 RepID=UPI002867E30F|nr:slipin family protein [Candidatus Hecatella orcuttiae]
MAAANFAPAFFLIIIVLIILASSLKIVKEYQRAVIFRLGRLLGAKGPGIFFRIPLIDVFRVVDLRVVTFDVPKQRVITRDNVSVDVDAAVYYRVVDPQKAVVAVENFIFATNLLSQTTLRDVLGQVDLDELLTKREELSKRLTEIIDTATDPWGIKVSNVAIKDVSLPEDMQRAIAKQAEAERERRSRIIIAEGEYQAATRMTDAAKMYQMTPMAMRLRELQTLTDIARERNLVVVTPAAIGGGADLATMLGLMKAEKKTRSTSGE